MMITKIADGSPVEDADVYNSLLAEDKTKVLVKEVAAKHEEAGNGEPAHYAQGHLDVPAGTTKAYIRFRIKLPGIDEEFTSDVLIKPHADEH
ncbi:MAG: hypothetical protein IIA67_04580 [Planctomycetes bacterium]|nr:hypothetical protein [Planctomycetota bacterium]